MNLIENLLIIAGASVEIFAAMECQGSLLQKVNKKQLSLGCLVVVTLQLVAFSIGYLVAFLYGRSIPESYESIIGEIIAFAVFICLGIRLLAKAIKNDRIEERRANGLDLKKMLFISAVTSIYTILTGLAFGFMQTSIVLVIVMVIIVTVVLMIAGVYTGLHFGFEQKTKAFIAGTALFWLAGADVVVRYILGVF